MGKVSDILKWKKDTAVPDEVRQLEDFYHKTEALCREDRYIAYSDYQDLILEGKDVIEFFRILAKSGTLPDYCRKNHLSLKKAETALKYGEDYDGLIQKHNDAFLERTMKQEKEYLDHVLDKADDKIMLDEDQRKAVLCDDDACLIVAGAGAGKTTTVAAKVKYLVERKGIDPSEILVVSFTNKAVQELQERINRDLQIHCPITTFHSAGNAILRKQNPDPLNIVESSKMYYVIQEYFKNTLLKDRQMVNNMILFFASYFDAPYEGDDLNAFFEHIAKADYSTLKSDFNEFRQDVIDARTKRSVTIQSEVLRSQQEVEIANFLYLNGIDYTYEPMYPYHILMARKPYTPDFMISQGDKTAYIEHFGISQSGKNNRYSEDQLKYYKKAINDKILLHRKHHTTLLYTFSSYDDGKEITEHLQQQLEDAGFVLHPRDENEIMEKLVSSEENRYIRKLVMLVCRFIRNFKTNGFDMEDFLRMYSSVKNVRTRLFLSICQQCYLEYERYLRETHAVDFEDMINRSAKVLREVKEMKQKLSFKYIIVDEYQDISRQRFDLVTALKEVCDAKVVAVGDDWQSIYAFSGSDISLFLDFEKKMGHAAMLKIVKTYRNAQEVIDIAGSFIQKNEMQITKELQSPKNIEDPVIIYTYDASNKKTAEKRSGANYEMARAVETALQQIMKYHKKPGSILLLGRYGFDADQLEKSGLFEYVKKTSRLKSVKYPKLDITFMTVHAAKGLGYDNVIVINGKNGKYGFPSKVEDDPVLSLVLKTDRSIAYAEERRLFYVAMTRTKNRVYFIAPIQNPSQFLLEIKKDHKSVVLNGTWDEKDNEYKTIKKSCPVCGYPMQYRYKNAYGLRLFICTNEPEVCGFMTNEYKAGAVSIAKCDWCTDGYLIVKPGNGGYFLGCTNYKKDGTGCSNTISLGSFAKNINKIEKKDKEPVSPKKAAKPAVHTGNMYEELEKGKPFGITYCKRDVNDIVYTVLSCLNHISQDRYYGVQVLADVLRGAESDRITKAKLNKVKEYGGLSYMDREKVLILIQILIEKHYILRTKHAKYPVLHPTYEGAHYSEHMTEKEAVFIQKELTK